MAALSRSRFMRWSYQGSWAHLDKLGPLARVFRELPPWARPCPMSVSVMVVAGQLGGVFAASAVLMHTTRPRSE